jgi:electron transfer flavoprotein alpha subunit
MKPHIEVIDSMCTGCTLCVKACPFGAITMADRPQHPKKQRLAVIDLDTCTLCGACVTACKFKAIILYKEEVVLDHDISHYKGVWVYAEQRHGEIASVVYELLNEGRKLAADLKVPLSAILLGNNITPKAQDLIEHGADNVYVYDDPVFNEFQDDPYADALAELISKEKPEIVLMGATNIGRSFASRVAAKIKTGLTADCTGLAIDPQSRNLMQTRPAFGGNIMATIMTKNHRPQMSTVRHKVFKQAPRDPSHKGKVIPVRVDVKTIENRTTYVQFIKDLTAKVNLADADIICSGGRGLGKPEGFKIIEELAEAVGGAVGSSRAAVDAGWIPYSHQVGQTGRTVAPKIYFACGISGAIQHQVGMSSSDIIVAINIDPDAPMMKLATFAIEGDLYKVIPEIIAALKT